MEEAPTSFSDLSPDNIYEIGRKLDQNDMASLASTNRISRFALTPNSFSSFGKRMKDIVRSAVRLNRSPEVRQNTDRVINSDYSFRLNPNGSGSKLKIRSTYSHLNILRVYHVEILTNESEGLTNSLTVNFLDLPGSKNISVRMLTLSGVVIADAYTEFAGADARVVSKLYSVAPLIYAALWVAMQDALDKWNSQHVSKMEVLKRINQEMIREIKNKDSEWRESQTEPYFNFPTGTATSGASPEGLNPSTK